MESKNAILKAASATPKKLRATRVIAVPKRINLKIPLNHLSPIKTPTTSKTKFTSPTHALRPKTLSLLPTVVEISKVKDDNSVGVNAIDNEQGEDKDDEEYVEDYVMIDSVKKLNY